jgi:hypothetical protein
VYECLDDVCKSLDGPPDTIKPGKMIVETGSSTASQTFLAVHQQPRSTICLNLFFKKRPERPVVVRFVDGALKASGALPCAGLAGGS